MAGQRGPLWLAGVAGGFPVIHDEDSSMKRFLLLCLGIVLTGCAGLHEPPASPQLSTSAERGRIFAQRACAGCHAVASEVTSPNRDAPPFWRLGQQLEPLTLRVALVAVSNYGHGEMPPIAIVGGEIDDVADYIASVPPPLPRASWRLVRSPGPGRAG